MQSFLRIIPSRALQAPYVQRPATRAFSCAPQLRLKEDKEQSPEQVEKAKQEQMKGNKNARTNSRLAQRLPSTQTRSCQQTRARTFKRCRSRRLTRANKRRTDSRPVDETQCV
ncbi:hypothetical protein BTJ68_07727 [Hortaea werneckii EXF-2000]|uniref:Uncharacterized protein n=1 Tax=Hortaea werneckii EXF-2000 TaxID=1157616 RepID=A0A1Z5T6B0_HORWE|nr:hypothetical protein BTJ68_07727 [Hortaea werneckii EXF-2000]